MKTSSVSSDDVGSVGSGSNPMLAQFAALLKSQAEALTAQTNALINVKPHYECTGKTGDYVGILKLTS